MTRLHALTFAVAMLAPASLALAQGDDARPDTDTRERARDRADTDGDGTLSDEEKKAARKHRQKRKNRRQKMLERFDTDGDGKLSEDEKAAAKAAMKERRAKILEQFDGVSVMDGWESATLVVLEAPAPIASDVIQASPRINARKTYRPLGISLHVNLLGAIEFTERTGVDHDPAI